MDITADRLEMTPAASPSRAAPVGDDACHVSQRLALAELLDGKVNGLLKTGVSDDFILLSHMAADMPLFKQLMDLSDEDE